MASATKDAFSLQHLMIQDDPGSLCCAASQGPYLVFCEVHKLPVAERRLGRNGHR